VLHFYLETAVSEKLQFGEDFENFDCPAQPRNKYFFSSANTFGRF
jgi:hypothetical protein